MNDSKNNLANNADSQWPAYTKEEVDAVTAVLLSKKVNYWTGEEGQKFEREFASFVDCSYAVALANGTVALDVALKALNVGCGDEVIVTSRTFIASVSSIVNAGAEPVFVDIDLSTQNITVETIRAALTSKTRAIMCVHLAGWPCEMDKICELAEEKGLWVIEDCAQAHGARFQGRSVGSFGHAAAWSFCQDKIMTTGGEGGMLTTNDKAIWQRVWSYKDHGKSWDEVYTKKHPPGFRWLHKSFGTNWRLTEMQSAIGRIQIKKMPAWHTARKRNAEAIQDSCRKFPAVLRVPRPSDYIEHAWYKCYVFVKPDGLNSDWSRDKIIDAISKEGVACFSGSCSEVYLEGAFEFTKYRPRFRLPVAVELGETSLMFQVHPTLHEDEVKHICQVIEGVMLRASP